ncbi:hypothetical protein FOVSG1_007269 [Fusarium oxysporum f. sp. vasinfectum]
MNLPRFDISGQTGYVNPTSGVGQSKQAVTRSPSSSVLRSRGAQIRYKLPLTSTDQLDIRYACGLNTL